MIPVFAYLLNGGLYIRDKVFIPFLPLLCYLISIYLEKCRKRELSFIAGMIPYIITTIFVYMARNQFVSKGIGESIWKALLAESILFLICYVLYCALKRYHKETKEILMLALPSVICLAVTMNTFYQMKPDRYVSRKLYRDVVEEQNRQAVKEALKDDDGYYRTEQMGSDDENAADLNRIWDVDQNITSIYSSAYNPDYQTFRQKTFGLEEPFRNGMMQSVSKNPVFQRMMGVRYIVSDSDVPGYTLVKKCGTTGIYQNKDAAPVMYATDRVMTEEEYKKLAFPYNQTAFLEYAVVGEHTESSDQNIMTAYEPVSLKMANNRTTGGAEQKTMQQEGQKQILFLRFRVDNAHPNKDVAVWINGIRNKLSAKDHVYYNENKIFTYAVPLKDGEDNISVTFGKGKYQLSHVQAYLGSLPERSELLYQSEIQVDKKQTEDNVIQGTIRVKKDGWFITSIPYDKHFKIYIDGKETEIQKVNTAFLGCKIESGNHELKIIYHAPGTTTGKILSLIGMAGFLLLLVREKGRREESLFHSNN